MWPLGSCNVAARKLRQHAEAILVSTLNHAILRITTFTPGTVVRESCLDIMVHLPLLMQLYR